MILDERFLRRDPAWWHLTLIVVVSLLYESLFLWHGVNSMDEGWPLYAAMQLHAGGTLYQDTFWVFPPGALLPAWLAYALDPPGLVLARGFYAAFTVLLCVAMYGLGRQLMSPDYALLGGLLIAVAAPHSHLVGVVFGYRYLLFSALALLCFSNALRSGRSAWIFAAGCLGGVALLFRLTPAFAVSLGILAGILAMGGPWRARFQDGVWFAGGLLLVAMPVVLYFGLDVGFDTLWREVVARPVVMTQRQALPVPLPSLPEGLGRWQVERAFARLEFWLYPLLYLSYLAGIAVRGVRRLRAGQTFGDPLLLATVVWGAVFLLRSYGRADIFHLESAIPPVCLLIAHAAYLSAKDAPRRMRSDALRIALVFGVWVLLEGVDLYAGIEVRGDTPVAALDGRVRASRALRDFVDQPVDAIERYSRPGETIVDLSTSPILHVLSNRPGVGYADVLMPGTFFDAAEESAHLERMQARQPSVVIVPRLFFDGRADRAPWEVAPRIFEWIQSRYVVAEELTHFRVLIPSPIGSPTGFDR